MRFRFLFYLAALSILLTACSTLPFARRSPVLTKLQGYGIDSRVYAKIAAGRVLTYADIMELVKKNVPSPVILTYVKSTKAPYKLTDAQLQALVDAGASGALVNYLGQSSGFYEATQADQTGNNGWKWKDHPYFTDPYYLGDAPWGYAFPPEWYDADWVGAVF